MATQRDRIIVCGLVVLTIGCSSGTAPDESNTPAGPDISTPYPIHRGGSSVTAPATYKGLPLQLFNTGAPTVTAVDGKIGIVCIGMSNANQECDEFIARFNSEYRDVAKPGIVVVNCAVGGHAIERWIDPQYDANLWRRCVDTLLPSAGLRVDQVRVLWHKAANQFTNPSVSYPQSGSDYEIFMRNLGTFSQRVKRFFPGVQAVYTTSRSYGGWGGANRGEPLSYEEGHALNTWLRSNGSVEGVWYGWGPYIWAPDCATGITNGAGVCYVRQDYVSDGVHPSASGRAKVSAQLHAFLMTQSWYRR